MARALVVDDSKFMRRIIVETLVGGGHEIIAEADNGADGIESYISYKPDFVTMDITMGGKDGIRAVHEIKTHDSSAKIIVISALNEMTIKGNDSTIQADAFLTKPFEKEDLLKTVEKLLS